MKIEVGARLSSVVCDSEVIVIRVPTAGAEGADLDLRCGGPPMVPWGEAPGDREDIDADHAGGTLLGKRYGDEDVGLELLVTQEGKGSLALAERTLEMLTPKLLPSSD
jgi:hypothetical protein